jgi:hypothetical protein
MKAFKESAAKQLRRAGLILLFVGEVGGIDYGPTSVTALMS